MKINREKTGPCEFTLTIEVENGRVDAALRKTARDIARRSPVPGFRPGKAPFHIIQTYFGKDVIFRHAMNELMPEIYKEAVEAEGLKPYKQGSVDIDQESPLILKAVIPVQPIIELCDYHAIREKKVDLPFDEAEIDKAIEELRVKHAQWKAVDRPAQEGDQVTINLKGMIGEETVLTQTSRRTQVAPDMFPQGLFEHVAGAKAGDALDYETAYPEDYFNPRFAGKTVAYHLEIEGVSERELPEVDGEFAQRVGGEYKTVEDLRKGIREKLYETKAEDARNELETLILKTILAQTTLEYPTVAVEDETQLYIAEMQRRVRNQGFSWEAYLNSQKKTEDEFRDEVRPDAEERLRQKLVLSKIADLEGIEVSDEEVEAEMDKAVSSYGAQAEIFKKAFFDEMAKQAIRSELRLTKTMDRLVAIATGELVAESAPQEEGQVTETPVAEGQESLALQMETPDSSPPSEE